MDEPLSNFERWRLYTAGLSSPQSFVDWSWIYTVCAALQRRVWIGPVHQPCYANIYVILVGPPGIGKGLCIREVSNLLRHWKLKDIATAPAMPPTSSTGEEMSEEDLRKWKERLLKMQQERQAMLDQPLFPISADSTTYEALVVAIGESYRYINYLDSFGKQQSYGHASTAFMLQELSSLFRKKSEDTVNLTLGMYDCPDSYEYKTLSRGKDIIRRGCLNILAGTTPSFMQTTFDSRLADEGFTSRTFFIFASRNRKNQFWMPLLSKEQEEHRKCLLEHLKNLSKLYGNVEIDDETKLFLQEWWNEQENNKARRTNKSPKMAPYYSRKNLHVMKVAMALHFSESVLMKIPLFRFKQAIKFLEEEEAHMHLALALEGNNNESKLIRRILEYLQSGPKSAVNIMTEVWQILPNMRAIDDQLEFLVTTRQIRRHEETDTVTTKNVVMYSIPTE